MGNPWLAAHQCLGFRRREHSCRGDRAVRSDLSRQGHVREMEVIYFENPASMTAKWTVACSTICILVRDMGGRGPQSHTFFSRFPCHLHGY